MISDHHVFVNAASYFKAIYFTAVDTAWQSLRGRFEQHSLTTVKKLEECVPSGEVKEAVKSYQQVDVTRLAVQLLCSSHPMTTTA